MKTRRPNFILAASVSALLAGLIPARAVDFTWANPGTGDWATASNWNTGTVPGGGGGNFVIINNGGTANITSTTNSIQDPFIGRGAGAVGHVNQTAGDHTNVGWSFIGTEGGTGTWDLSGSTNLTTGRIYLGGRRESDGGSGTMTVATTGTVTLLGDLSLGSRGGTGTLNVSSGTVNAASWMIIGESINGSGGSTGVVNQTGGVVRNAATDLGGRLWLGSQEGGNIGAASTGTYNLIGGTLNARNISIGKNYTGIFNQSGGIANFVMGDDDTRIGSVAGSTGTYALSGGVLNSTGNFQVGAFGNGTMTVNGGTMNNAGWLAVGRFAGGTGTMAVSSGAVNHNNSANSLIVGEAGTGVLTISGTGLVNVNSTQGVRIGHTATANGTINLDGGTLGANFIQKTDASSLAKINLNGGTLKANANSADFFLGLSSANLEVQAGGANFDSNGFSATITQDLNGAGSFTKLGNGTVTLASPTNAYAGITTISAGTLSVPTVSAGGAPSTLGASSSAAANLVFDGGALGYTGGSATFTRDYTVNPGKNAIFDVSTVGSVLTLAGNSAPSTGGLTKVGNGTLSLVGTALPTGTVNVNGGVLAASGSYANAFAVNNGGHLTAQDAATGALTVPTLALNAGSNADFEFDGGAGLNSGHDIITIGNAGGLSLTNTGLFLYQTGTTNAFTANGTYTLFDYSGSFTGAIGSAFTIANSQTGKLYQVSNNAGATTIELSIADVVSTAWATNGSGLWTVPGNWTAGVPNSFGAIATFGGALTSGPATVTVNGPKTVGVIIFDNANSYTLSGGAGDTITLNNGSGTPLINQISGSHTVAAPLSLLANTNVAPAVGTVLTLSGDISGAGNLNVTDGGTVVLAGTNSYAATNVNSGALMVGDGGTSGSLGTGPVALSTGTLLTFNRSNPQSVANNLSGAGAVTHAGTGALTYSGTATYTGATMLNGPFINDGTIKGTATLNVESTATLRGNSVINAGSAVIGTAGAASVTMQNSAALNLTGTSPFVIGDNGSGSLTMNDSSVLNDPAVVNTTDRSTLMGDVFVGRSSGTLSVWTLNGASSARIRELRVGDNAGSTGQVDINGTASIVSSFDFHIGRAGTGVVNVNGGSLSTNTGWTQIGIDAGSTGSLNIGAGTFTSREVRVGEAGTGSLSVTGGTLNATMQLTAGNNGGGSGTIAIGGTATVNLSAGASIAGVGDGAIALSGGTINDAGNFIIGNGGTRTGQMSITGGTLNVNSGELWVGQNTGGNGTLDITAGTVNVNNWLAVGRQGATGLLTLGGTGVVNKKGINHTIIGSLSGIGTVTQTGGTFNSTASTTTGGSGGIRLGENAGGLGLWDISGGTATADFISVGWVGTGSGELRISGTGVVTAENNVIVAEGGAGTVNLNGGTLKTSFVTAGTGGAAVLNFNGGVLAARADETDFIRGFTSSNLAILGGGATIDTNGFKVTVAAPLTGIGPVTKIGSGTLTLTGTQDYPVLNTQAGRTDITVVIGTGTSTVSANAQTNFSVDQTLGALNIGNGGFVTIGALPPPTPEFAGAGPLEGQEMVGAEGVAGGTVTGAVPEPGSTALLLGGIATLLGFRRRR